MENIYILIGKNKLIANSVLICGLMILQVSHVFSQDRMTLELTYDKTNQLVFEYLHDYYTSLITYDKAGNRIRKLSSSYLNSIIEVGNNRNDGNMKIYPVPSTEEISVSFTIQNSSYVEFSIFSIDGKQRYKTKDYLYAGKNIYKINISEFPSGPYVLKLIGDVESYRKTFIIK